MATFYADSAGSQGTGTGVDAANACTLKQAIENDVILHTALVANTTIWCKNGTTISYDGSAGVYATASVLGLNKQPIRVETYTTNIGDGGVTTLTDTNAGATNDCIVLSFNHWHLTGFKIINPKTGVLTTANGTLINNVEVGSAAGIGISSTTATGDSATVINCYVHDGAGVGFGATQRDCRLINCVASNNAGIGFSIGSSLYGVTSVNNIAYKNGGHGFAIKGESEVINCTSYGNTSSGFYINSPDPLIVLLNCGSASNGAYGIEGPSDATAVLINCAMNPTNETNTSGKSTLILLKEINEIIGDPLFTDTAPAVLGDLSLGSASAWKGTGSEIGGDGWTV